ncbi:Dihydroceramide fatty acyl 2-hydroxylase FAH2 [Chlorella vulgaris]
MATPGAIDEDKPLLAQLAHLSPAQYQDWLHRTSRAKARFFASDSLEALTHVKWFVPVGCLVFMVVITGVALWQLIEYSIHRFLFHAMPASPLTIVAHFLMHGNHHKCPCDIDRLVFPPLPACLPASVIYGTLRAFLSQACASGVFAGVLVGYVAYDCMHYLMHSGRLRGRLRTRHIHHHFDDNVAYGISSPLLDVLLRTNR